MNLFALALAFCASPDVQFTDCSLRPEGDLLGARFINVDADAQQELVLALVNETGQRELHIHELTSKGMLEPEPRRVVPILADVIAWTFCDVREEPGPELIFLTPGGAHSMSLEKRGLRGNLQSFIKEDLVFRIPDARRLDYWPWVVDRRDSDLLLLPTRSGMALVAQAADEEARIVTRFERKNPEAQKNKKVEESDELEISSGSVRFSFGDGARESFLLAENDRPGPVFLSSNNGYDAPAMADVDGDGQADLLMLKAEELWIYASSSEIGAEPQVQKLPKYLVDADPKVSLSLLDLDNDGDADLLGRTRPKERDGFENGEHTVLVLLNRKGALFPPQPTQVMRFAASQLRVHIADINADKTPDLFTRTVILPSVASLVTGLKFTLESRLHLGNSRGGFERKPALKEERVFDENGIQSAVALRHLTTDCSGDGIADLVAVDLLGRIVIRRLKLESGFFSGDSWELERAPWKRFESRGSILSLEVEDWNGDGIGDILSFGEDRLALYLSRNSGGSR